ncbi:MAG: tRNA (guanosine(46)-N7)-methyltransferase TrmB [Paludibacteraceae bacterium]|nr:tRNA (guanosine(46)-N7)-methyltransferase TrmB [Paludibacteraceae bacterium]
MGKNKLQKFAEMKTFDHVFQYPFARLQEEGSFPLRGQWSDFFGNGNPLVLELGCGRGEYTVALSKLYPDKNFIGIDIKGARMWAGAKQARQEGRTNTAFLRTSIELIDRFFAPDEVSEIWITFPDPQMKKVRKRLTSCRFLTLYQQILKPGGLIHLKTDSPFLYTYTHALIEANRLEAVQDTDDLYHCGWADEVLSIKTYYEMQWIDRGKTIKYIQFHLPAGRTFTEPDIDIPEDDYRSFNRSRRSQQNPTV